MMTIIRSLPKGASLDNVAPMSEVDRLITKIRAEFHTVIKLTVGRFEDRIVHFRLEFHGGETWCFVANMAEDPVTMDCVSVAFGSLGGMYFDDGVTSLSTVLR